MSILNRVRNLAVAAAIAALPAVAGAAPLSGTFNIDIYNYNAGGNSANALANAANAVFSGAPTVSVTYTGALDFGTFDGTDATTIADWFATGGGAVAGLGAFASLQLSADGYQATTLFDITGYFPGTQAVIRHDDGISLYDSLGVLVASSANPTTEIETTSDLFAPGDFRLIYVAANGDPSVLNVSAVPLPAAGWLLVAGFGALVAVRRRKTVAA